MGHDLSQLERHLENLQQRVAELHNLNLSREMLPIIRKPGWTTPAEYVLVLSTVEALTHNLENQIRQSRQLLEAAGQIETETKNPRAVAA